MDKSTLLELQQLFAQNLVAIDNTMAEKNKELLVLQEQIRILSSELQGLASTRNYHVNVIAQQIAMALEKADQPMAAAQ